MVKKLRNPLVPSCGTKNLQPQFKWPWEYPSPLCRQHAGSFSPQHELTEMKGKPAAPPLGLGHTPLSTGDLCEGWSTTHPKAPPEATLPTPF